MMTDVRLVDEDELARYPQLELAFTTKDLGRDGGEVVERLLHGFVLDRVQADRAGRTVQGDDERGAHTADVRIAAYIAGWCAGGVSVQCGSFRNRGHAVPPRRARFTALRTRISFSVDARLSAAVAASLPMRPNAIAAHARNSGSSFLPNSPREFRTPSSRLMPGSPHSVPKASNSAIFSVRSASRASLPLIAASIFASAGRCARAAMARAVAPRTSRCAP